LGAGNQLLPGPASRTSAAAAPTSGPCCAQFGIGEIKD
jgi:hypothetical protein